VRTGVPPARGPVALVGDAWNGQTEAVLTTATRIARAFALVVVGLSVFTGRTAHGTPLTVQAGFFAAGAVLLGAWALVGRMPARRRALGPVLAALAVCSAPATTADGGALIAFAILAALAAGAETSLVVGCVVTGIGVIAVDIGAIVTGASTGATLGYPLLLVVSLLAGRNRAVYRLQAEQSAIMIAQLQALRTEQRQVAALDERARIAREIHDVLAHSLGALGIQIQTARALLSDSGDVQRSLSVLDAAQRMATEGLVETRRAVHALRSDTRPLAEELTALACAHQARHDSPVEVTVTGSGERLGPDAELALLRAAQESLVNAGKHAPGQAVTITLEQDDPTTLRVTHALNHPSDGTAARGSNTGGYGLVGMRERLLLLGGSLSAGPDGSGWSVVASVPR
jgi:signal transduction histidine kinase